MASINSFIYYLKPYIIVLRPHNFIKNILIFLPILAAQISSTNIWIDVLISFVIFSLSAGSMYILNDIIDLNKDLLHSTKKKRPIASGKMSIRIGVTYLLFLQILILSIIMITKLYVLIFILLSYYILVFLYSKYFKNITILDVFIISIFYIFRVVVGVKISGLEYSIWIINFVLFLFLGLALLKRYTELNSTFIKKDKFSEIRPYNVEDKNSISLYSILSITISIIILCTYLMSDKVLLLYENIIFLWLLPPTFFAWMITLHMSIINNRNIQDPIIYCLKLKSSWFYSLFILLSVFLGNIKF